MQKSVTIIVPIYNTEKYLNRCVDALINQTYKNLEIILVNDGSSDGCLDICKEYEKNDVRIKVINISNGGQGRARNKGLDIAEGDFIMFCDSDDWYDLDMVEHLVEHINVGSFDIAMCGIRLLYRNKNMDLFRYPEPKILSRDYLIKNFFGAHLLLLSPVNKLYKKKVFDGLRYPEDIIYEDAFIGPALLTSISRIISTGESKYNYFIQSQSTTYKNFSKKNFDFIKSLLNTKQELVKIEPSLIEKATLYVLGYTRRLLIKAIMHKGYKKFKEEYNSVLGVLEMQIEDAFFLPRRKKRKFSFFYRRKKLAIFYYRFLLLGYRVLRLCGLTKQMAPNR